MQWILMHRIISYIPYLLLRGFKNNICTNIQIPLWLYVYLINTCAMCILYYYDILNTHYNFCIYLHSTYFDACTISNYYWVQFRDVISFSIQNCTWSGYYSPVSSENDERIFCNYQILMPSKFLYTFRCTAVLAVTGTLVKYI